MTRMYDDGRYYAIYYRFGKATKWEHAEYGGRWRSPEEALEQLRDTLGGAYAMYRIEHIYDGLVQAGRIND